MGSEFIIDDLGSVQEIDRCFQEREVLASVKSEQAGEIVDLKIQLAETRQALAAAKEALHAETKSKEASEKMNAVLEREVAATTKNFEQAIVLVDRATKIAEAKKSSLLETWGPLGIIAVIIVTIASVL